MMTDKMEIFITSPSLNPQENVSGISEVVRFILSNNKEYQYTHFEIGKRDTVKEGIVARVLRLLHVYCNWKKQLKEKPKAAIHYNFPLDAKSVLRDYFFIRYAYRHERKMVVHIHGGAYLSQKKRPWIIDCMMRKIFSWNLSFIVLGDSEKQKLEEEFSCKNVEVLPNCIDLGHAASFVRGCKLEKEPLVMGYLGRIEKNKGLDWLLLAANELVREKIPFKLRLAGKESRDGEYLERFSDYIGDSFEYAGVVQGKGKEMFLCGIDVFVLPSYFEGLPMALLESMSYGAVPLTTPVGSIPDVVEDGVNGLFIKVRDEASIVEAFLHLHRDRELHHRLSMKAKEQIFTKFTLESYVEKLRHIYRKAYE